MVDVQVFPLLGLTVMRSPTSSAGREEVSPVNRAPQLPSGSVLGLNPASVKGGVNLDHFGGAKVDQLVKG